MLLCPGVEQGIENLSILYDVVLETSFEAESGFFQHARGCGIVREHLCRDSAERNIVETEITNRGHHFSHDAASPELLCQPVTNCRCMPMHVLGEHQSRRQLRRRLQRKILSPPVLTSPDI